jgi:two-component system sensor histidine kinase VanS
METTMDRRRGLSARVKLTLSYAGFLMVAGALMLVAAWFAGQYNPTSRFLLPFKPDGVIHTIGSWVPGNNSFFLREYAPTAFVALAFLLVFGLLGGWLLAGRMLAPLSRITHATRLGARGSLSHRIALEGRNDEFRELADSFDAMLARLEAHVAEQQRFAANASHELRTPLATTRTLLEVARNDPDRTVDELIGRLHVVNARAIDLTEALLVLSRADQRSFAREAVDLSLIAEEAAETLLPLAEKRGVTIQTSGEITPAMGSHALLLQLTTNLLHNAIVHNLPERGTVRVDTTVSAGSAVLTVENTGDRLTPRLAATLTEPFQRGTERVSSDQAGVGLGLAIVERITHAHDGDLAIVPLPDGGIRVIVRLPAVAGGANGVSTVAGSAASGTMTGGGIRPPIGASSVSGLSFPASYCVSQMKSERDRIEPTVL